MLDAKEVERLDVEAVNRPRPASRSTPRARRFSPSAPTGNFRQFKWLIMAVTLGIYYLTPWIRWDRGPYAPDQAVLVDLANRRFYFFFIEIWPQEFYYVAGLLIMAGIGLFLVTSTVGRAWCGYTCPQTVWIDLFLVVERWHRGRPQRPHQARQRAVVVRQARASASPSTRSGCVIARCHRRRLDLLFRRRADAAAPSSSPARRAPVAYITVARPDRHDLRLRRADARAGLHLHVPVAAHPGGDARRELADRHLQRLARRAALAPRQEGRRRRPFRRRLRRLQRLRRRLPDGHRHPRRPAARMHHLRAVHRRLRRRHGQDRQGARPDLLCDARRLQRQHGDGAPSRRPARSSRRACATQAASSRRHDRQFPTRQHLPAAHPRLSGAWSADRRGAAGCAAQPRPARDQRAA